MQFTKDYLYIPGGVDINPKRYGQQPLSYTQASNDLRDKQEFDAVEQAIGMGIPIIGICRG